MKISKVNSKFKSQRREEERSTGISDSNNQRQKQLGQKGQRGRSILSPGCFFFFSFLSPRGKKKGSMVTSYIQLSPLVCLCFITRPWVVRRLYACRVGISGDS